jgi:hypothetical protein
MALLQLVVLLVAVFSGVALAIAISWWEVFLGFHPGVGNVVLLSLATFSCAALMVGLILLISRQRMK